MNLLSYLNQAVHIKPSQVCQHAVLRLTLERVRLPKGCPCKLATPSLTAYALCNSQTVASRADA